MSIMITLMLLTMMLTIFLNHPLSLGLTLLLQTIMTALVTGLMSFNFWYSYILFLVMVGGMLILFIYMTSLASNEKFNYSNKLPLIIFIMLIYMMIFFWFDSHLIMDMMKSEETFKTPLMMEFSISLSKFLNYPNNLIFIMIVIHLLITLIAVVKITNIKFGPLRQK